MKTLTKLAAVLLAAVFLIGCPGLIPKDMNSPADMNPKELATWALGVYNVQYDNYKVLAARTDLTEDYKAMLRKKKKVLMELWPLLKLYTGYVDSGVIPTQALETKIIGLIDDLILSID